jgi:hypothetical protein
VEERRAKTSRNRFDLFAQDLASLRRESGDELVDVVADGLQSLLDAGQLRSTHDEDGCVWTVRGPSTVTRPTSSARTLASTVDPPSKWKTTWPTFGGRAGQPASKSHHAPNPKTTDVTSGGSPIADQAAATALSHVNVIGMGSGEPPGPVVLKAFQYSGGRVSHVAGGKDGAGDALAEIEGRTDVQPVTRTAAHAADSSGRKRTPFAIGMGGSLRNEVSRDDWGD